MAGSHYLQHEAKTRGKAATQKISRFAWSAITRGACRARATCTTCARVFVGTNGLSGFCHISTSRVCTIAVYNRAVFVRADSAFLFHAQLSKVTVALSVCTVLGKGASFDWQHSDINHSDINI